MDHLADDVLVEVMQYVAVQDLLALRLVCKRLRDLALHRDVWRLRTLEYDDPLACTVLRLAPCLQKAHCRVPQKKCHMLYTTRCAVADLTLQVDEDGAMHAAACAIRNQEALGRLRSVAIYLSWISQAGLFVLLGTLVSTAGLVRLDISGSISITSPSVGPPPAVHNPFPTASLKRFECTLQRVTEPFCNSIISAHRSTLEEIFLNDNWEYSGMASSTLAPLLAGMPNLWRLQCPLLPGMEALAACATLRTVFLYVRTEKRNPIPPIQEGAAFLRRATQLRQVSLIVYARPLDHPGDVAVGLALALAACGKSRVRELTIRDDAKSRDDEFSLQPLLGALPSMPALRVLSVEGPPDQLLPGISPATAPALRMLDLQPYSQPMGCVHSWLHSNEVRAVLSLNPWLHIGLLLFADACETEDCQTCSLGCHQGMWDCDQVGFFSHDPSKKCSRHDSWHQWFHLPL